MAVADSNKGQAKEGKEQKLKHKPNTWSVGFRFPDGNPFLVFAWVHNPTDGLFRCIIARVDLVDKSEQG